MKNEENLTVEVVETPETNQNTPEMKLDDARRVKVVSPSLMVAKRFFRNKLALVGLAILLVLFLFCFLGAAIYPYTQSQTFTTHKDISFEYAFAKINSEYTRVKGETTQPSNDFILNVNSSIKSMVASGSDSAVVQDKTTKLNYRYVKKNDNVYMVEFADYATFAEFKTKTVVGTYTGDKVSIKSFNFNDTIDAETASYLRNNLTLRNKEVEYGGNVYSLDTTAKQIVCTFPSVTEIPSSRAEGLGDDFSSAASANLSDGAQFTFGGRDYVVMAYSNKNEVGFSVKSYSNYVVFYATTLNFDRYDLTATLDEAQKFAVIGAIADYDAEDPSTSTFAIGDKNYRITTDKYGYVVSEVSGEDTINYLSLSVYSVRRYSGEDTVSVATKHAFTDVMLSMVENGQQELTTEIKMEALNDEGEYIYEDGVLRFDDEEFVIRTEQKGTGRQFVFKNEQNKLVADTNAKPSAEHVLGLDANAMDVLARIMYGGRVSLLIGFIVVIIEIVLGSILGGISGYFGGVVDDIIMRIVDIFYCIPTMPILIILGAMFDSINLDNTLRVVWMMAVLGFLGWPGIARLVRGQILSLREQDFMTAAEASGLTVKRKILRHLIPNVIPQLIVQATMGLGNVILTESTLSFLGLGVKFPMATWGQIINSVSSINAMKMYTYIWIPVGLLICLAVIAFNFVGDGLRDAFDPKMNN